MGKLVKNAPTSVVVCVLLAFLGILASTTLLVLAGKDPSPTMQLVQTIVQGLSAMGGFGALLFGSSAAASSHSAKEQTNGVLDQRMTEAVQKGITAALGGSQTIGAGVDESATKGH